MTGKTVTFLG